MPQVFSLLLNHSTCAFCHSGCRHSCRVLISKPCIFPRVKQISLCDSTLKKICTFSVQRYQSQHRYMLMDHSFLRIYTLLSVQGILKRKTEVKIYMHQSSLADMSEGFSKFFVLVQKFISKRKSFCYSKDSHLFFIHSFLIHGLTTQLRLVCSIILSHTSMCLNYRFVPPQFILLINFSTWHAFVLYRVFNLFSLKVGVSLYKMSFKGLINVSVFNINFLQNYLQLVIKRFKRIAHKYLTIHFHLWWSHIVSIYVVYIQSYNEEFI